MAIVIDVRVIPRSARSGLAGSREGVLTVRLHSPPVDGAANAELVDVLSAALGVPKRAIEIVAGQRGRRKKVRVEGVTQELVRAACGSAD